jgi:hypothetical protein
MSNYTPLVFNDDTQKNASTLNPPCIHVCCQQEVDDNCEWLHIKVFIFGHHKVVSIHDLENFGHYAILSGCRCLNVTHVPTIVYL